MFVKSDSNSGFDISSPSLRKFVFPTTASAREEELSKVDWLVHTLIGGSIERSIQKDECDRLFEESLEKDTQKAEELATLQSEASKIHTKEDEALRLQRIWKCRVPPEPTLADDHIVLSVHDEQRVWPGRCNFGRTNVLWVIRQFSITHTSHWSC